MGCFGYICPVCVNSIRSGEECLLIHKREGREIGRAVGHYDGYGRVEEDDVFRGENGPNSHVAICTSEFSLDSSFAHGGIRVAPDGKTFNAFWVRPTIRAFVQAHSFEELAADGVFSAVATDKLLQDCKKDVEFTFFLSGEPEKKDSPEAKELIKLCLSEKLVNGFEMNQECLDKIIEWTESLPKWEGATSGVVAVHKICCKKMDEEQIQKLLFSLPDPEQGCGRARKKFGAK